MFENLTMVLSGIFSAEEPLLWEYDIEYDVLRIESNTFSQDKLYTDFSLVIPRRKSSMDIDLQIALDGVISSIEIPAFTKGRDMTISEFKSELNAVFNQKKYANIIKLIGMNVSNMDSINESIRDNYDVTGEVK